MPIPYYPPGDDSIRWLAAQNMKALLQFGILNDSKKAHFSDFKSLELVTRVEWPTSPDKTEDGVRIG